MRGKRATEEEFDFSRIPFKKIGIALIIIVVIVAIVIFSVYTIKKRKEVQDTTIGTEQNDEENKMLEQIDGYDVLGQLFIEKIDLEEYILDSTESGALEKAPVKLYGEELNKEGNFCIAGHNYEEIFARLNELVVGDEFYIVDKEDVIQDYKVTEILEVDPTDLKVLMPVQDKIQVTLITCEEGASKRLVIKAERIEIEV